MSSSFSKNILLTIQYEGSTLKGWQDNKHLQSVENKLKRALSKILEHEVMLQATSRTDAGVHALDQKANFILTKDIPVNKLPRAINTHLPKTIRVIDAEEKPSSFHPTLDCTSKEYFYYLCLNPYQLPFYRHTSWHVHHDLNIDNMKKGAASLIGEHDFSSFCTLLKYRNYKHHRCAVESIKIERLDGNRMKISIRANRFLYRMARAIVGHLVAVGKGEIEPCFTQTILDAKDRAKGVYTAPPQGLFLAHVSYLKNDP